MKWLLCLLLLCPLLSHAKYEYHDRLHTKGETFKYVSSLYVLNWGGYYLSQPDEVRDDGSIKLYKKNFGKIGFDLDSSVWNQFIHPYVGSQVYLFYRSLSYSRLDSFLLTALQSALFEFTVENYTEPASAQDLYQTPVLGSLLGLGFEEASVYLLNQDNTALHVLGHIINPCTLLPFFEGHTQMTPIVSEKKVVGLNLVMDIP